MTETIIKVNDTTSITKLIASEGMVLTNGEAYGKELYLGKFDSPDNWHEITDAQYEEIQAMLNQDPFAENPNAATAVDYQNALREMGVKV